jgi:hypothetical protein
MSRAPLCANGDMPPSLCLGEYSLILVTFRRQPPGLEGNQG